MRRTLVDTSVWIEHLRRPLDELIELLRTRRLLTHSAVLGELACGPLPKRTQFLPDLDLLPKAVEAEAKEVLLLIEERHLFGKGIGWIDAQLMASALLSGADLLTFDKRLDRAFSGL